jgi:hypothetical protein
VLLLYATIWIALVLLVAAEIGRPARWARVAWIGGGVLAAVHAVIAIAVRYNWDHALAVRETARQGMGFGPAIYVNYLFIALWVFAAWTWRHWLWRLFVLTMVTSGAIVFARPAARPFGAALVAALAWAWTRARK